MSQTSSFSLPIGPVHIALEEPVYFHLDVDGETVRKVEITSGHVHRGMEGMATQRNFFKNTTLTERVCSLCSNSHSLTYCMAVENVLGMTPPPRAQYLRVLAEETKRVASHLFNIAIFAHNVGFKSLFLHIMEVRENMQDVKETIYGNRMNLSANCIGGVKFDMDDGLTMYMLERLGIVEEAVKRVEKVFRTDPLIAKRSRGVGVLSREDAWALGVVGPVARGSGLDIDVRKNTPYLVYPDLYFDIVKEQDGDVWSRAMVRVREVFESIRLLRQCLLRCSGLRLPRHLTVPPGLRLRSFRPPVLSGPEDPHRRPSVYPEASAHAYAFSPDPRAPPLRLRGNRIQILPDLPDPRQNHSPWPPPPRPGYGRAHIP